MSSATEHAETPELRPETEEQLRKDDLPEVNLPALFELLASAARRWGGTFLRFACGDSGTAMVEVAIEDGQFLTTDLTHLMAHLGYSQVETVRRGGCLLFICKP